MFNLKSFTALSGIFGFITLALVSNPAMADVTGTLNVKFSGLKSANGQVCANLFSGSKGFPNGGEGAALRDARCASIVNGTATISFPNVAYGNYAIAAVHDTNGDRKVNNNFLGIPKEGFGFSNNPRVLTAPPSFVQAQFLMSGASSEVQIQMQYLN